MCMEGMKQMGTGPKCCLGKKATLTDPSPFVSSDPSWRFTCPGNTYRPVPICFIGAVLEVYLSWQHFGPVPICFIGLGMRVYSV